MMRRRGFSLAELMVALVIAGVIGVALTRLVISQARFVGSQDGIMRARAVARSGLAVLSDELRQVSWGGVVAASPESILVRIPVALGVACAQVTGQTIVALLPPDSARYAGAGMSGYAWRDGNGVWNTVEPATRAAYGTSTCWGATPQIGPPYSPSGTNYSVALTPNVVATPVGAPIYIYQRIRYYFGPSVEMPGREALWREMVSTSVKEEMVAPYDTSSRFLWLAGPMMTSQAAVPASLDSIRGVRVLLVAVSENPAPGRTVPTRFPVTADIVFRNREN